MKEFYLYPNKVIYLFTKDGEEVRTFSELLNLANLSFILETPAIGRRGTGLIEKSPFSAGDVGAGSADWKQWTRNMW